MNGNVSNMLQLILKQTDSIDLTTALELLISNLHAQYAGKFESDISQIQRLRDSIISITSGQSGLNALMEYYAQLIYMATKFPNDIGVEFLWRNPSHPSAQLRYDDLYFERANVLFNIGVLFSQLGVSENRSTREGLRNAFQSFQNAAGCFLLLNESLLQAPFEKPEDFHSDYLCFLLNTMLAQAQECIWQRSVIDQMKDKLIAQLSEQVSVFYSVAADALNRSTLVIADWIHHLRLKKWHFAAAAQLRMSAAAMSSSLYGEEVSRLRLAAQHCREAQRSINHVGRAVAQDFRGLQEHVEKTLNRAEKDNDMIYVVVVPPAHSLNPIQPTPMAKGTIASNLRNLSDMTPQGGFLFTGLVSFAVRTTSEIYKQRKDNIVKSELVNKLHSLDLGLQTELSKLGLPGSLSVLEQPLGLPSSIVSQSAEVRQVGGPSYLEELLDQVGTLALSNIELVEQTADIIEVGLETKEQACSAELTKLQHQIGQYEEFLEQARLSDELVKEKLEHWADRINLLASDEVILRRSIPDADKVIMSQESKSASRKVRSILDMCDDLVKERKRETQSIICEADDDDISGSLVEHAKLLEGEQFGCVLRSDQFESIIETNLERYTARFGLVVESAKKQNALLDEIRTAHADFLKSKTTSKSSTRRETLLQDLDTAYHKFMELVNNLDEGAKFYNDFHKAVNRLGDEAKLLIHRLSNNRDNIPSDLVEATKGMALDQAGRSTTISSPDRVQPGVWSPSAGISFGEAQRSSLASPPSQAHLFDPTKHKIVLGKRSS